MSSKRVTDDDLDQLLRDEDLEALTIAVAGLSAERVVAAMGRLAPQRQALLFRLLDKDTAMSVFERLDPPMQTDLVAGLRSDELVTLVEELDPDDRVALFDELPARVADRLLHGLSPEERRLTSPMLGYARGSIGRRMSPEYVRLHPSMTVAESLDRVRALGRDAETVHILPVTDSVRRLVGIATLEDLFLAEPTATVESVRRTAVGFPATASAEGSARTCTSRGLLASPIVDSENRMIGIVTIDDALRILEEAEAEDAARAGGTEPLRRPYLSTPITRLVRARVVWLLVLAISAILTVSVLEQFEATLSQAVVLALFIPLLTGIGGNTGAQAATTLTRALAVADVGARDIGVVAARETRVGLTMGLLLGGLGLAIATPVYGVEIGVVIGTTLVLVCMLAAVVGGAMPLVAKSLRVDPAVFSTPFISTFCDATGLLIYFSIARLVLRL